MDSDPETDVLLHEYYSGLNFSFFPIFFIGGLMIIFFLWSFFHDNAKGITGSRLMDSLCCNDAFVFTHYADVIHKQKSRSDILALDLAFMEALTSANQGILPETNFKMWGRNCTILDIFIQTVFSATQVLRRPLTRPELVDLIIDTRAIRKQEVSDAIAVISRFFERKAWRSNGRLMEHMRRRQDAHMKKEAERRRLAYEEDKKLAEMEEREHNRRIQEQKEAREKLKEERVRKLQVALAERDAIAPPLRIKTSAQIRKEREEAIIASRNRDKQNEGSPWEMLASRKAAREQTLTEVIKEDDKIGRMVQDQYNKTLAQRTLMGVEAADYTGKIDRHQGGSAAVEAQQNKERVDKPLLGRSAVRKLDETGKIVRTKDEIISMLNTDADVLNVASKMGLRNKSAVKKPTDPAPADAAPKPKPGRAVDVESVVDSTFAGASTEPSHRLPPPLESLAEETDYDCDSDICGSDLSLPDCPRVRPGLSSATDLSDGTVGFDGRGCVNSLKVVVDPIHGAVKGAASTAGGDSAFDQARTEGGSDFHDASDGEGLMAERRAIFDLPQGLDTFAVGAGRDDEEGEEGGDEWEVADRKVRQAQAEVERFDREDERLRTADVDAAGPMFGRPQFKLQGGKDAPGEGFGSGGGNNKHFINPGEKLGRGKRKKHAQGLFPGLGAAFTTALKLEWKKVTYNAEEGLVGDSEKRAIQKQTPQQDKLQAILQGLVAQRKSELEQAYILNKSKYEMKLKLEDEAVDDDVRQQAQKRRDLESRLLDAGSFDGRGEDLGYGLRVKGKRDAKRKKDKNKGGGRSHPLVVGKARTKGRAKDGQVRKPTPAQAVDALQASGDDSSFQSFKPGTKSATTFEGVSMISAKGGQNDFKGGKKEDPDGSDGGDSSLYLGDSLPSDASSDMSDFDDGGGRGGRRPARSVRVREGEFVPAIIERVTSDSLVIRVHESHRSAVKNYTGGSNWLTIPLRSVKDVELEELEPGSRASMIEVHSTRGEQIVTRFNILLELQLSLPRPGSLAYRLYEKAQIQESATNPMSIHCRFTRRRQDLKRKATWLKMHGVPPCRLERDRVLWRRSEAQFRALQSALPFGLFNSTELTAKAPFLTLAFPVTETALAAEVKRHLEDDAEDQKLVRKTARHVLSRPRRIMHKFATDQHLLVASKLPSFLTIFRRYLAYRGPWGVKWTPELASIFLVFRTACILLAGCGAIALVANANFLGATAAAASSETDSDVVTSDGSTVGLLTGKESNGGNVLFTFLVGEQLKGIVTLNRVELNDASEAEAFPEGIPRLAVSLNCLLACVCGWGTTVALRILIPKLFFRRRAPTLTELPAMLLEGFDEKLMDVLTKPFECRESVWAIRAGMMKFGGEVLRREGKEARLMTQRWKMHLGLLLCLAAGVTGVALFVLSCVVTVFDLSKLINSSSSHVPLKEWELYSDVLMGTIIFFIGEFAIFPVVRAAWIASLLSLTLMDPLKHLMFLGDDWADMWEFLLAVDPDYTFLTDVAGTDVNYNFMHMIRWVRVDDLLSGADTPAMWAVEHKDEVIKAGRRALRKKANEQASAVDPMDDIGQITAEPPLSITHMDSAVAETHVGTSEY